MPAPSSITLPALRAEPRHWKVASIFVGLGVSLGLFLGLAYIQRQRVTPPPAMVDDLRAVALPVLPPPPTTEPDEPVPIFDQAAIQLAASPSPDSSIRLPAAPIPSDSVPPVRAIPRFDLTPGAVKPSTELLDRDVNHIYNRTEVDQKPLAIFRKTPELTAAQINTIRRMKVAFMLVAGVDGKASAIQMVESSGSAEVDQACIAALREWRFKPAIKKGRPVRCWVHQNFIFKINSANPFELTTS